MTTDDYRIESDREPCEEHSSDVLICCCGYVRSDVGRRLRKNDQKHTERRQGSFKEQPKRFTG